MVKFVKTNAHKKTDTKRYSVATVAQAIGRSEGSISGYFSNKGISTKGGITLTQIDEYLQTPVRGTIIKWDLVEEIRIRLCEELGYEDVATSGEAELFACQGGLSDANLGRSLLE